MWPLIEALLAAIGAATVAFVALYAVHHWWTNRGDWKSVNVDWSLAYDRLWERYLAQDAEIRRLKGAASDAGADKE
jgi:hypothetical protein